MIGSPPREHPETILSWQRALVAFASGLVASTAATLVGPLELVPIVGWVVATIVVLTWTWRIIWPQDAAGTERLAECEGASRTTDTGVLAAAVASLGAVVLAVVRASSAHDVAATAAVLLSLVGAILSWALVNTVFALKYARLYYMDVDGGIDFKQREPPAYSDFAHLAFTVGNGFATGFVAVAINLVTNL